MEKTQSIIVLVDSSISIEKIKEFKINYPKSKIFTFDYDSHVKLNNLNIEHKISDEYLENTDLSNIQNKAYLFSDWFNEKPFKSFIYYDEINLGKLFYEEIIDFMIQFLKKFEEIRKISEEYSDSKFFSSPQLFEIIHSFSTSCNVINPVDDDSFSFTHDKVRYNFKIGGKYFIFYLSRSTFLKIKSISEKFTHFFFGPKKFKIDDLSKNTLLVEFNTLRFSDFILSAKNFQTNLFFYGRRRPAIWNFESFNIIKKSKCKIITENRLDDKHLEKKIHHNFPIIKQSIDTMFDSNYFNTFFQISKKPFWKIIKPTFENLFKNRLKEVIREIELIKKMFNDFHFDNVLIFSEIGLTEQIISKYANQNGVPLILLQIGLHIDSIEAQKMNRSKSVYPELSDRFFVWGKTYAKDAEVNAKIPTEKIIPLGSPRFDNISASDMEGDYVLIATSGPQHEDIHGLLIKNIKKYEDTVKQVCKNLSPLHKIVIKLHPSAKETNVSQIVKQINDKIIIVTTGDIGTLISSCKVMICIGFSTSMIEAQLYQKPVITIPVIDYDWGIPGIIRSNSCLVSNSNKISEDLESLLSNSELKNNLIQNSNNFLKECITNRGKSTKEIWKYLNNFK